jgi:hypothetical protein
VGLGGGRLAGSSETLHYVNYEIHHDFLIEKEALPLISKYSKLVEGGGWWSTEAGRFYRDLLGLEVRSDEMQPIGGMPTLYANPETGKRGAVNLRYGKGNDRGFLVLSERPGGTPGEAIKLDHVGISHFSWWIASPKRKPLTLFESIIPSAGGTKQTESQRRSPFPSRSRPLRARLLKDRVRRKGHGPTSPSVSWILHFSFICSLRAIGHEAIWMCL